MPSKRARTPDQARKRFKNPLQASLTCVSDTIWCRSKTADPDLHLLTLGATPALLRRQQDNPIFLSAAMIYSFYKKEGEWRVHTNQYIYQVSDDPDMANRLLEWHWHPPTPLDPHLHVAGRFSRLHIPTGRVTFEKVAEFLVGEMSVIPRRSDWQQRLQEAHAKHLAFRSWS